jgi:hypothetical protein
MTHNFEPAADSAAASEAPVPELPILGEWSRDDATIGMGFFPEELGLRPVHPQSGEAA